MVGNDVVDLEDAESDIATLSSRWLQRVFTLDELHLLETATDRPRMHWRLWAAKEAAYKWARQVRLKAVFSPRAFEVTLAEEFAGCGAERIASETATVGSCLGHVAWGGERVPLMIEEGAGFVHAWVTDVTLAEGLPRRGVACLPASLRDDANAPSRFVRDLVVQDARADFSADDLEVIRDGRIPHLRSSRGRESAALSLSHHGRFVAFAWWPSAVHVDPTALATLSSSIPPTLSSLLSSISPSTLPPTLPHMRRQARVNEVQA